MATERTHTKPYELAESERLFARASKVIPAGIYGHFNPRWHPPQGMFPHYCARAEGARFWDVDGNEYIDLMCAYGPMILGYANPVVDEAYRKQAAQGDTATLASPVMIELAEYLVDLVPMADWAFFAKNGADVTNLAVRIARATTGRDKILAIDGGYHGSTPWMQGPKFKGVVASDLADVVHVPWNDVAAIEQALDEHTDAIAAFIATPYHHAEFEKEAMPAEGYWAAVQALLKKHGVVFISDDIRSGFRIDLRGSHEYFGFEPDLVCFCKAIANGYPISALVGTDALKDFAGKVFHTGSFWFSAGPMAAALACLQEMKRIDAPKICWSRGERLLSGMAEIASSHGHPFRPIGAPSMPYFSLDHPDGKEFHEAVCGECTRRGAFILSAHNLFLSAAHTEADIDQALGIFDDALHAVG